MVEEFHSGSRVRGRMRRAIAAREWEEEEEVGSEQEWERVACLLGFVGMRVHVRALGSVRVCVPTPGAHPPSLFTSWRALSLSGPFFPLPLLLSIPSLYLLSPPLSASPPALLSAPLCAPTASSFCSGPSPPCCRIFIDSRRALDWLRWAWWIGAAWRVDWIDLNAMSGRNWLQGGEEGTIHPVICFCRFCFAFSLKVWAAFEVKSVCVDVSVCTLKGEGLSRGTEEPLWCLVCDWCQQLVSDPHLMICLYCTAPVLGVTLTRAFTAICVLAESCHTLSMTDVCVWQRVLGDTNGTRGVMVSNKSPVCFLVPKMSQKMSHLN